MHPITREVQRPTILVVEDDALILDMVVDALEGAGFDVIGVSAAEDALGLAVMDVRFDALFTDIDLGGPVDGWELAETLREMRAELPVIYTSGRPPKAACFVPGSTFVAKPYGIADLCALMERLVRPGKDMSSPTLAPAFQEPSHHRAEMRVVAQWPEFIRAST
jgi:DNA-binding response OmpR family regulator